MKVRTTIDMKSATTNDKLSAGDCGTVIQHCREGICTGADNIIRVLKVKYGEREWNYSEAHMQSLVINEH